MSRRGRRKLQQLHNLRVVRLHGHVDWPLPVLGFRLPVGSSTQQQLHHLLVPHRSGSMQSSAPTVEIDCLDAGAVLLKQRLHTRLMTLESGYVEGGDATLVVDFDIGTGRHKRRDSFGVPFRTGTVECGPTGAVWPEATAALCQQSLNYFDIPYRGCHMQRRASLSISATALRAPADQQLQRLLMLQVHRNV
eukprot:CAMPEP_0177771328 /NCGR_PEP_ID=MMETSP0491_2-20121128/11515_1 /TAXON_ID=63592 /ORGANISM="Tetraselmis chuii, Strain PLY429" /LENGTH=191 /DNA_ID=CAMNT_0019288833 /DNA_START=389 /DNA_END=964 /DNA_ORIENTATION=+